MTSPSGSPALASERFVALDSLRGLALFGVLMVNLLTIFRVSLFDQFLPLAEQARPPGGSSSSDVLIARAVSIALESKAFVLFSLLFGIGLAAQHERTESRGVAFGRYVTRRLGFLLVLGLAHLFVVWNGDILTLYAVVGAIAALLMRRLRSGALLVVALVLLGMQALPLPYPPPFASFEDLQHHVAEARLVYGSGTFRETLAFRVHEVRPVAALLFWVLARTLGVFLIGACLWRAGILRGERRGLVRALAVLGIASGAGVAWAGSAGVRFGRWNDAIYVWGALLLALGYAATVMIAFGSPHVARVLSLVAPLVRMALTSYLTQSIVLSAIFYGWGLGLFGRIGETRGAVIGLAIYVTQAVLAALWLRRYRFGPVEWSWRWFTYGASPPMRR